MIFDTDVQNVFAQFSGSGAIRCVVGACVVKSIHILPVLTKSAYIRLYDRIDYATGPLVATFVTGKNATQIAMGGIWIRIPGNGLRFDDGVTVYSSGSATSAGDDEVSSVSLVYQQG